MLQGMDKAPPQVVMTVTVVQVPRGFAADSGLTGDSGEQCCGLSAREARMLTALFRAAKARGELEVLSRPMMQVADGQTGTVRVGQEYPVPGEPQVRLAGGVVTVERTVKLVPVGLSLKCTPRISPDGRILLTTEFSHTEVAPTGVEKAGGLPPRAPAATVPAFNTHCARGECEVRDGGAVVLSASHSGCRSLTGAVRGHCSEGKFETLVIITPHIVAGQ
jgi:Flp pilus assembly secretin CpaC